jgi:thiamine-phosphate pyrophosphorylase
MDRRHSKPERVRPRFILVTPAIEDAASFAPKLTAACRAGDVAAVILRLVPAGDSELLARARVLVPEAQATGAALLLDGLIHLVAAAAVDGAHVANATAVQSARSTVTPSRIVGAGGLALRHDAMVAAEGGADYAMFGEPDVDGRRTSLPALIERVTWWAELFEIPGVAFAGHIDEIPPLVQAGADFIALGDEVIWNAPEGPSAALAAATLRLGAAEPVQ